MVCFVSSRDPRTGRMRPVHTIVMVVELSLARRTPRRHCCLVNNVHLQAQHRYSWRAPLLGLGYVGIILPLAEEISELAADLPLEGEGAQLRPALGESRGVPGESGTPLSLRVC